MRKFLIIFLLSFTFAQDDLLSFLEDEQFVPLPIQGTFKATRIVNAQSVELPRSKTLEFIITHRFGTMSNGFYDLYGLDEASARFDLSYGFNEKISLGAGRSSHKKTYDFFSKIKLFSQKSIPSLSFASVVLFSKVEIATIAILQIINKVAIIAVNLVRKVPIVLADVKLSCETPKPKAPPSDRCKRITITRITARIILTRISKLSMKPIYSNSLLYQ